MKRHFFEFPVFVNRIAESDRACPSGIFSQRFKKPHHFKNIFFRRHDRFHIGQIVLDGFEFFFQLIEILPFFIDDLAQSRFLVKRFAFFGNHAAEKQNRADRNG